MLKPNYNVFNSNPGRNTGGVTDPTYYLKSSTYQLFYYGDHAVSGQTNKAAFPCGYAPPYCWQMAPVAGGISSSAGTLTFSGDADIAGGLPGYGSTSITFSITGTGGLIVSGSGTTSITFSQSGELLSIASGSGSSAITLSGAALIGALAGLSATSSITFSLSATIRAIGYLEGLATNASEFSPDSLAAAVWDALATDYNTSGTMGAKMNAAGGSNSPDDIAAAVWNTINIDATAIALIADIILRRSTGNIEGSVNGDPLTLRSLYGMISQAVHKTTVSAGTLTVTKSDDTTTLGTRTVTTDGTAEPIVGFDTD